MSKPELNGAEKTIMWILRAGGETGTAICKSTGMDQTRFRESADRLIELGYIEAEAAEAPMSGELFLTPHGRDSLPD